VLEKVIIIGKMMRHCQDARNSQRLLINRDFIDNYPQAAHNSEAQNLDFENNID
jgi:hypothetical protein